QPHVRDRADVKWAAERRKLRGPHFDGVVVGGDRGDLFGVHPRGRVHRDPRRFVQVEMAPVVPVEVARHVTRADDQQIAATDLHPLGGGGRVEVGRGDRVAGLERAHALPLRDVEEHTTPDDPALGLVDAVLRGAAAGDEGRIVAVEHLALVEDGGEAVPLRDPLRRHHDPVVRAAVSLHRGDLRRRPGRVAAVAEHRVDRVEALARAALRALALERNPEREHLAGRREPAGRGDRVRRDEVQGADLVGWSPAAPVADLHRDLAESLFTHGRQSYANARRLWAVNVWRVTARTDRLLLAHAIMGQFITGVATRIFIVSLPTLAVALDTDIIAISWALIVYQLAGISLSVVFGRLGDIHGRYTIYGLGFAIMTVSFVLCGLAPNAFLLIVFRFVQGLGAAMIASATRVLAMEAMPEHAQGRANGYMTMGFHSGLL